MTIRLSPVDHLRHDTPAKSPENAKTEKRIPVISLIFQQLSNTSPSDHAWREMTCS
ncbi:hypothetical protein HMPREF9440_00324 [Sutterella parvirubra YIT 11816]|uniref:Uncharacterized protein n=1 Tax=Sutterella parvirubra YIT 11816 TaxID=762967 RepID=H3KC74_9BURK|nr:hypothetical protein HMPREF9440_00324 [Sutterella parvirubra YIT 11816]